MRRRISREHLALALIILIGVTLRIVFVALPRVVRWDEAAYQMIARSLLAGQGYVELVGARDLQQPPMVAYLSLFGLLLRLPLAGATAGIAQVLLGGLIPLPIYGLGREIYGRRVGLIAVLLAAVHPALAVSPLYWSTMTEPPYILFILCAIYAAWRAAATGKLRWAAALGVATGLAYLTRPEAMVYLAVLLLFVVVCRLVENQGDWIGGFSRSGGRCEKPAEASSPNRGGWIGGFSRSAGRCEKPAEASIPKQRAAIWRAVIAPMAVAMLIFLLLAAPYVVYVYRVTGRWTFSGKQGISIGIAWAFVNHSQAMHDQAAASLDPAGREIMWLSPEQFDISLLDWIREDPKRFAWQVRQNAAETWQALFHQDLFSPWMVALMALGLFARPWPRTRVRGMALLLLALAPLASLWVFFVLSRFLAIVIPIGLLWAAAGVEHLAGWIGRMKDEGGRMKAAEMPASTPAKRAVQLPALRTLPLALTLLALLWAGADVARREMPGQPFWRVDAAQWLVTHVPPGSPVMTRNSETPLYAGLPMVAFPNAAWSQVYAYGQARGARYLLVDDKEITAIRPQLAALLDTRNPRPMPGVKLLAQLPGQGQTTLVFEFVSDW